jgi:hypothetical protein
MRNWHRLVIVVAVFASIATSKPKWHLEAHAPPVPILDEDGSVAVIEASQRPEVRCQASNGGSEPSTQRTVTGTRYELVCRPGLHFNDALILGPTGGGGGCRSNNEPPDGEFLRFVEVRPVKMWRADASSTVDVVLEDLGGGTFYGSSTVVVDGATVSAMSASLASVDATIAPEVVPWGDNRFEIRVVAHDHNHPRVTVALHAFGYGTCTGECTPSEIRVERTK